MAGSRFLFPLSDFNRIYRTAHGTLQGVTSGEKSCIFFAAFGAAILNMQYKTPARAVAGAFGITLKENEGLVFGVENEGRVQSSDDGFHMWVQTQSHVIDFMSPIYQEAFQENLSREQTVPRLMFQKEFRLEAANGLEMSKPGDFFTIRDEQLTNELIDNFFRIPQNSDLLEIALSWFGNRRSSQRDTVQMVNDLGEITSLKLANIRAIGSW
jgi:Protein of unknown function (DUF2026)